jgi:hypothetical protein
MINGSPSSFFRGGYGLRQVSLRAYLFTLVMEIFSQLLEREVNNNLITHSTKI